MLKINIATNLFAATAIFKGVKDIRYYLNGMYIETGPEGGRIVATDGKTLAVARIDGKFPEASIIVPGTLVDTIKPKKISSKLVTIYFEPGSCKLSEDQLRTITVDVDGEVSSGIEIDGKFPDYRRVIPNKSSGKSAQYDPLYTSRLSKAALVMGSKKFPGISYNGDKAGFSLICENLLVVINPLVAEQSITPPEWAAARLTSPENLDDQGEQSLLAA